MPHHRSTTLQGLYGNNVPAQFSTGLGSNYTVTANQVTRNKFDGTVHANPKNMFYITAAVLAQIVANQGTWVNPRVSRGFFSTTLDFTTAGGVATSLALSTKPAIGLTPLDMLLQANGDFAPAHRLHYGHPITAITPQPGCCFITTACVEAMGLADDCAILTTLRGFRDGWLAAQPGGPELIATYYRRSPELLAAIMARPDGDAVLSGLYQVVAECAALVAAGQPEQALDAYMAMIAELEHSHGDKADGLILAG